MFKRLSIAFVLAASLVLGLSHATLAQTSAYSFTTVPISYDSQLSLGFDFTTNSAVTVSALGYYDYGNDGFLTDHTVGIFDLNGNLLTSTTLLAGTGDPLVNGFRYQAITPITLAAGQTYTAAATTGGPSDPWAYGNFAAGIDGFSTDPAITIASGASRFLYQPDNILRDPTNTIYYTLYAGPNFEIAPPSDVTPEASSLVLFSGPALFGGLCLLRRRLRRS
ncbi:MAG TPA: DUF4082 domain-containing protein [Chthonomonadaceae bacterium]|nr:DUF4082 domain-containing protein [Chthonomonadaceae bacterium]